MVRARKGTHAKEHDGNPEVILVHPYDPVAPGQGGYPRYVQCLLEGLLERGIETTLLGVRLGAERFTHPSFTFVPLLTFDEPTVPFWSFWRRLNAQLPRLHIPESAIIHVHHPYFVIPFSIFCPKNPKVCTLHGGLPPYYRPYLSACERALWPIHRMVTGYCLAKVDRLLPVGANVLASCVHTFGRGQSSASILPVPVDLQRFRPVNNTAVRLRYHFDAEARLVMYVGRLEFGKQKHVDRLIVAFKLVRERLPTALLILVGDGQDRERLEHLTQDLGLEGVIFMGEQPPDKIPALLNAADVFALPSAWESGPFVVKEALACGIPVVATAVGDVPQLISSYKVGRIVQAHEDAMSQAILEVLQMNDEEEGIRKECRKTVMQFGRDQFVESIIKVYKDLGNG